MDGTVVSNSSDTRLEDLPATHALLESGEPYLLDLSVGGQSYRVAGTPVFLAGQQVGAVEIAGSLSGINDTLQSPTAAARHRRSPRLSRGGTGLVAPARKSA